ncbi:MAG TPA: twin-arginine translocase subunit TatC, partial [Longimicrobiaceae bacterium]|nr:twin-arginine translocase subunit TatC [Longimicrobiaceae bacterium]
MEGYRRRSERNPDFIERVEEVRRRILWSLAAVAVGAGLGFLLAMKVDLLGVLTGPIQPYLHGAKLQYLDPMEPFFVTLKLGIAVGLVLALPVLLHNLWAVAAPLLRPEEKRIVRFGLIGAVLLFAGGAVFCFLAVVPLMLKFVMHFQEASLEQSIIIGEYLSIVLHLVLAFGIVFELPVVVLIGTLLGLVKPEYLAGKRRHAVLLAVILGAMLTPPDVAS